MSIWSKFNPLGGIASKAGTSDKEKMTYYTTPWVYRTNDGIWVGYGGDVWVYRLMDVSPMLWEDPAQQLAAGSPLATLLYELATTSKDLGVGVRSLSKSREIHLLALTWEKMAQPPDGTPEALAEFMESILQFAVPAKALVVGVKVWSSAGVTAVGLLDEVKAFVKGAADKQLNESGPRLDQYAADIKVVTEIMRRNGATRIPDRDVRKQMEAWYNHGRHTDPTVLATRDMLFIGDFDRIEMAVVESFDSPVMHAPNAPWALSAQIHPAGASVISVRGKIEPSSISRNRIRKQERRLLSQMEEEAATGDLGRQEHEMTLDLARQIEGFVLTGREPLISDCSIVFGRRVGPEVNETYMDELRNVYGIEVKPLEHRQMPAVEETLPGSSKRTNPHLQDVSVSMLAHAGLQGFSNLGDPTGAYVGLVDPDYVPLYLNPLGAPAANREPAMLIAGDPGSGKTFLAQMIALQSALAGLQTIFINPKADDTLEGLAELVDGSVIRLSQVEEQGGFFDPFRFCRPDPAGRQIAADILAQHIFAVLGSRGGAEGQGFTQEQEIAVSSGLREAANNGATYAAQAIQMIPDEHLRELIKLQAQDPLFRLAIGFQPQENLSTSRKLLLIEFDKPLDIPEKGTTQKEYTRTQRLAVAAVQLVTRASMEILANSQGGVMVVDEAWMYLQSSAGLAAMQSFGRLGRSKNILPIFATQRVDDLLGGDVSMEGYLSRVFVMKLNDDKEASAALKLCGLEPTRERIDWLKNAGPRRGENGQPDRGAMALHRDLKGRHSAVLIGPVPEAARLAFSTNPEDRAKRRAAAAARAAAADPGAQSP